MISIKNICPRHVHPVLQASYNEVWELGPSLHLLQESSKQDAHVTRIIMFAVIEKFIGKWGDGWSLFNQLSLKPGYGPAKWANKWIG